MLLPNDKLRGTDMASEYTLEQFRHENRENMAWKWAVNNQGYTGTFSEWLEMDADEREEYEQGAQGIPTPC